MTALGSEQQVIQLFSFSARLNFHFLFCDFERIFMFHMLSHVGWLGHKSPLPVFYPFIYWVTFVFSIHKNSA